MSSFIVVIHEGRLPFSQRFTVEQRFGQEVAEGRVRYLSAEGRVRYLFAEGRVHIDTEVKASQVRRKH
jgi:hypothetical protein